VELYEIQPERKVDFPRSLYMPLWAFDLGGGIDYSGEVTQTETEGFRRVQRVVRVRDQYPVLVNDFVISASKKTADIIARILPTFDLSAIKPYDLRYLADWPAEIYDISMSDASLEARGQVAKQYKERLRLELSHMDKLQLSSAGMTVETFRLVLLPVWITEIRFKGESHSVLINGQNGRIVGDAP
jgi:hypothetical protein